MDETDAAPPTHTRALLSQVLLSSVHTTWAVPAARSRHNLTTGVTDETDAVPPMHTRALLSQVLLSSVRTPRGEP